MYQHILVVLMARIKAIFWAYLVPPKVLVFYSIFWQNGSKHHGQKQQNLGCKTFGI
jgi:hypothetical protein